MGFNRYALDSQRITWQNIDDEVIIIDLDLGNYYTLTKVGASVWTLIEQGATMEQIVAAIVAEYETESVETVRESVSAFLAELVKENLVQQFSADDAAPLTPPTTPAARPAFEAPLLEKYTDMQTLLLIDPIHQVDQKGWPNLEAPQS